MGTRPTEIKNIVIIGYHRLEYWKKCIEGIRVAINELSYDDIKLFAFLDGPPSLPVEESIQLFKSAFQGCNLSINSQNEKLGSDCHIHYALENSVGLSDKLNETFLIVEDDVILNKNSLVNLNTLIDQIYSEHIGSYQLWNENHGKPTNNVIPVESTQCHWWGYTLTPTVYQQLRPFLFEYYELVKGLQGKNRPVKEIKALFSPILEEYNQYLDTCPFSDYPVLPNEMEFQRIRRAPAMSQDMAMAVSLLKNKLMKIAPYYPICTNIGEIGAHMSPSVHQKITSDVIEVTDIIENYQSASGFASPKFAVSPVSPPTL